MEIDWTVFLQVASIGLSSGLVVGFTALCIRFAYIKVNSVIKQSVRIY